MAERDIRVALLGFGTVGSAVHELIETNRDLVRAQHGLNLRVTKALVRDIDKARSRCITQTSPTFTTDPDEVFTDDVDVITELIGGVEPARTYVTRALEAGTSLVTANKKLLASHYNELATIAAQSGARMGFEASVCAGVPVLRSLTDGLRGSRVTSICGIVNGTCNFILTRMAECSESFDEALRTAQERGFAEADPSTDIDGIDSLEKAVILAGIAFGATARPADIPTTGIRGIEACDIYAALQFGCVFRLVAAAEISHEGDIRIQVHPVLLGHDHPLSRIRGEENAVTVTCDSCGELTFCGRGSGGLPTASAVVADIIDVVTSKGAPARPTWRMIKPEPFNDPVPYYLRAPMRPEKGLIERCHTALSRWGVGLKSLAVTRENEPPDQRQVTIVTDRCRYDDIKRVTEDLAPVGHVVVAPMGTASHQQGIPVINPLPPIPPIANRLESTPA